MWRRAARTRRFSCHKCRCLLIELSGREGGGMAVLSDESRVLWGKTPTSARRKTRRSWHPLACHMIDSAEAASWLWDCFLSPGVKRSVEAAATADGADVQWCLRLMSALHDLGKATPSFQIRDDALAAKVRAAGLPIVPSAAEGAPAHAYLSGLLVMSLLTDAGWDRRAAEWVALTMAGHHGVSPPKNWLERRPYDWQIGASAARGADPWQKARDQLVAMAAAHAGLAGLSATAVPAPALPLQLVLSGAVILADWLASNEKAFAYTGEFPDGYLATAAARAGGIGAVVGMRDRWEPDPAAPAWGAAVLYRKRFGRTPRPVQMAAYAAAAGGGRGLLLIEAPTGEGKTEAALAAAELLAVAAGADGLFIGLPTKATANQMYSRVVKWLKPQPGTQVVTLAHGSARRNTDYRELIMAEIGADEHDAGIAASEWLEGRKKALLASVVVGTIDQLLLGGVSSRHVALRHLGLSGKVVVIDEVHACDAHMSAILQRVLAWLGAAQVPVILLSATLPATQRQELLAAYAGDRVADDQDSAAYPRLSWVAAPARVVRRPSRQPAGKPVQVRVQEAVSERRGVLA